jgi:uncharacterized damage-inducible protein DinB
MDRDDLIAAVGAVHGRTYEAAECLTDQLLAFRPRPGEFTAAELTLHIANTRLMNLQTVRGEPAHYPGHAIAAGQDRAWLLQQLLRTSKKTIAGLVDTDLDAPITTIRGTASVGWRIVLTGFIEHEVHHRAQLCEYLSAAGVEPPPLYGLHTEDLPR